VNIEDLVLNEFITNHPLDAARILENHTIEDIVSFLSIIPYKLAANVLKGLEQYTATRCLEKLDYQKSATIVLSLEPHLASTLLRSIANERRNKILEFIPEEISNPIKRMLDFPSDCAAALVDLFIPKFPEDISIKEALEKLKRYKNKKLYYLYIVSREQIFLGMVTLQELFLANQDQIISSLIHPEKVSLPALLNFNAVINNPGWENYHSLPVVDNQDVLLGAIHYETIKQLGKEHKKSSLPKHAVTATNALGELYQIGISGLFKTANIPLKEESNLEK